MCVSQRMICGSPGFSFPGCPRDQAQGIRLSRSAFAFWAIFLALCLHCFLPSHLLVTLPYSGLESGVKALTELSLHLLEPVPGNQFLAGLVFFFGFLHFLGQRLFCSVLFSLVCGFFRAMGLCCRTHVTRCSILGVLVLASHFLCLKASDDIWWESSPLEGLKSFWILLALLNPNARAQWYLPVQDILLSSFGFTIYL